MIAAELPDQIDELDHCAMTPEQIGMYQALLDTLVTGSGHAGRREASPGPASSPRSPRSSRSATTRRRTSTTTVRWPAVRASWRASRRSSTRCSPPGERVLVFTHFAEWGLRLAEHLTERTGTPVSCYHGGLSRTARDQLVKEFQEGDGPGALVLSLKAGGTGLNLTAASHVVLYDRWWNPAVEDQARDRAWRIGQTRTVICHRLICPGTVDERVEEVVAGKRRIADLVLPKSSSLADLDSGQLRAALGIRPDALLTEDLFMAEDASARMSGPRRRKAPERSSGRRRAASRTRFLGERDARDEPVELIRPAEDPTVMLRSLSSPPLPGRETVAVHYFAAVAEKAAVAGDRARRRVPAARHRRRGPRTGVNRAVPGPLLHAG